MGALSALDIALWDIKDKAMGVPVYRLLGGPTRERARLYCHVKGRTVEELVAGCLRAKEAGFTAVGRLNPFLDEPKSAAYFKPHTAKMRDAIENVRLFREAVGDEVDLCVEVHRRLTPAEAVVLGRGIEEYHPMFLEDPIPPDGFDAMVPVARQIPVPIATGERLHNAQEFDALLSRDAVQYARTSVCLCGGITGAKKIAALAEARHAQVAPHNPLSPVSLAACLQLDAATPNFAIQEYPTVDYDEDAPQEDVDLRGRALVKAVPVVKSGFAIVPDVPGISVELVEGVEKEFPPARRVVGARLHAEGSVVDR